MHNFFYGRESILDVFESKIFSTKSNDAGILNPDNLKLKVRTTKQMLQRLPIALAQVKATIEVYYCLFFVSIKANHKKSIK